MKISIIVLLFVIQSCLGRHHEDFTPPNLYSLKFPSEPNLALAFLSKTLIPTESPELSVALWVNQSHTTFDQVVTFFSYGVDDQQTNAIYFGLKDGENWQWEIASSRSTFKIPVSFNEWVHYALTWRSKDGSIKLYVNGELVHTEKHSESKEVVWDGQMGQLVLGQEQSSLDATFGSRSSFRGEMTEFHLWDKTLSIGEVEEAYMSRLYGNIVNWEKVVWSLRNDISVITTSPEDRFHARSPPKLTTIEED